MSESLCNVIAATLQITLFAVIYTDDSRYIVGYARFFCYNQFHDTVGSFLVVESNSLSGGFSQGQGLFQALLLFLTGDLVFPLVVVDLASEILWYISSLHWFFSEY